MFNLEIIAMALISDLFHLYLDSTIRCSSYYYYYLLKHLKMNFVELGFDHEALWDSAFSMRLTVWFRLRDVAKN